MSSEPLVYLNGDYVALQNAHVSVLDRGFIFGDGVYEVIPVFGTKPFHLTHHLERLNNSLRAVKITNPLTTKQWLEAIEQVISRNNYEDQSVYLQVTRGVAPREHTFPGQGQATIFIMTTPLQAQSPEISKTGIRAITLQDNRWSSCHIKSISLLPNILLRQEALDNNAEEAILIRDGQATEGTISNLFIVQETCLITPPVGPLLLPGVTRDLVVEIAHKQTLCLKEQPIMEAQLAAADEIWLTSSTKEILPVTQLNGKPVGQGKPGKIWQQMMQHYQNYKQTLRTSPEPVKKP